MLDNLNYGKETVTINGKSRHVISYLRDFLFPAQKVNAPVKMLSGGERNRLLLAKIFLQSANLMVLDEPTNDLDVETLELLEELLSDYDGTLLLVSHDRTFLDNVVTSTLVMEGDGKIGEYVGGYEDWIRQSKNKASKPVSNVVADATPVEVKQAAAKKKKLSYKEQAELDKLPKQIEALEEEKDQLQQDMTAPDFYQQDKPLIKTTLDRIEQIETELLSVYARWEQLDQ